MRLLLPLLLLACSNQPNEVCEPDPAPGECPSFFDADLQDLHIELTDRTWERLHEDYRIWNERPAGERKPYHPIEKFQWGCHTIYNARIRLKGNPCCSWEGDKLQFTIAFNKEDPNGRFLGMRKIGFDAPYYDPSMLRERLAFDALDRIGEQSSCANHTRLNINGEYYGIYTSLEMVDKTYLTRHFGKRDDLDEGNLYKYDYPFRGFELRTNEDDQNHTDDFDALQELRGFEALSGAYDMDHLIRFLANETVLLQSDGFWAGSINYYAYHHPQRGWMMLPWDWDNALDYWPAGLDPFNREDHFGHTYHVDDILTHAEGSARFTAAIKEAHADFDRKETLDNLDDWAELIRPSLVEDPFLPYPIADHDEAVEHLRLTIEQRETFLDEWVEQN